MTSGGGGKNGSDSGGKIEDNDNDGSMIVAINETISNNGNRSKMVATNEIIDMAVVVVMLQMQVIKAVIGYQFMKYHEWMELEKMKRRWIE